MLKVSGRGRETAMLDKEDQSMLNALRWHWDKHHIFILQVLGRKRFRMARSPYFARPIVPPVPLTP